MSKPIDNPLVEENKAAAKEAGLRYVTDKSPGFSRKTWRKSFQYFDSEGNKISSADVLDRIKALVIPPAWEDVWICKYNNGHLQCTGYDARKRKQYRYHADWNRVRNETKFEKLAHFGELLPRIRAQVKKDLAQRKFSKEKVVAAVVQLMEATRIRIGNDLYAEENESYGLTTLLNRHVKIQGQQIHFHFKGKSGVVHKLDLKDAQLSKIIKRCQDLPGQELFAYEDEEGLAHDIGSTDVNEYLQRITGEHVTAKDFRTWSGTVKALELLTKSEIDPEGTKKYLKLREVSTIKDVASHLGNTVAVCRKYYIHPKIFEADAQGQLRKIQKATRKIPPGLTPEEGVLLRILKS